LRAKIKEFVAFLADYSGDIFLLAGVLVIVFATWSMFGMDWALYVTGAFFVIAGIVGRYLE
jgi:hypothetical protein